MSSVAHLCTAKIHRFQHSTPTHVPSWDLVGHSGTSPNLHSVYHTHWLTPTLCRQVPEISLRRDPTDAVLQSHQRAADVPERGRNTELCRWEVFWFHDSVQTVHETSMSDPNKEMPTWRSHQSKPKESVCWEFPKRVNFKIQDVRVEVPGDFRWEVRNIEDADLRRIASNSDQTVVALSGNDLSTGTWKTQVLQECVQRHLVVNEVVRLVSKVRLAARC